MKRIITLVAVAAASLLVAAQAHAQFGIVAGLTSSNAKADEAVKDVKNIALYHAGLTYKIDLGAGFAIQPEVLYQVKGMSLDKWGDSTGKEISGSFETKVGYVEVPVNIQWGPDLIAFRPFVFAEPFVGYQITSDDSSQLGGITATATGTTQVEDTFASWSEGAKNRLEYGFGLGVGVEILGHIQISAQYFTNLGNLYNEDQANTTVGELSSTIATSAKNITKDVGNFQGIKVNVAILF